MADNKINSFQQVLGSGGATGDAHELPPPLRDLAIPAAAAGPDDSHSALGTSLLANGFHPVLIFGTRATGKTTFLTSMLSFFTSMPDAGVTVTLGDPLSHTDVGSQAHESAERLFHVQVNDYLAGTAPVQNQDAFPFFVPLELRKLGSSRITKIALMESSGELWQSNNYKNNVLQLREEILEIYRTYRAPLSVMIVVPYAMSEAYTGEETREKDLPDFRMSDASLLQALQIYQRNRPAGIKDEFYFVLTKWDMHTAQIASEEFINPDDIVVAALIEERFPRAFNYFKSMATENRSRYTVYSAGLIGGTKVLEVPAHLTPMLQEFPYRLWRWIFANATGGEDLYAASERPRGGRIRRFFGELFS